MYQMATQRDDTPFKGTLTFQPCPVLMFSTYFNLSLEMKNFEPTQNIFKNAPCSAPSYLFFLFILIASLCLPEFIFIDFSRIADCITVRGNTIIIYLSIIF